MVTTVEDGGAETYIMEGEQQIMGTGMGVAVSWKGLWWGAEGSKREFEYTCKEAVDLGQVKERTSVRYRGYFMDEDRGKVEETDLTLTFTPHGASTLELEVHGKVENALGQFQLNGACDLRQPHCDVATIKVRKTHVETPWVECTNCKKWRKVSQKVKGEYGGEKKWYCRENADEKHSKCED